MYMDIFDTSLIKGSVKDLKPISIFMVSGTEDELIWDELVAKYHYLGHKRIMGRRIKYLVLWQERPIAALSFNSAVLRTEVRDTFIGWDDDQREENLHRVVNNNRFLIFPWVRVKYLASHLLSCVLKRLPQDWEEIYGIKPLLVETFVDLSSYQGTSYRAANWIYVGKTKGFSVKGKRHQYHGNKKGVFLYPLQNNFRDIMGIEWPPPKETPTLQSLSGREEEMLLHQNEWDPQILEEVGVNKEAVSDLNFKLYQFHNGFDESFTHQGQRKHGLIFLRGLMSNLKRKSLEPIALHFSGEKEVRLLQHFFHSGKWNEEIMLDIYQRQLSELIADQEAMITIDETDFPKKGKESVGVARQYCGVKGKTDNCQAGIFVGYTSNKGYGLLDRRLYMPKKWFKEEYKERFDRCQVPEEVEYLTKTQISDLLIERVEGTGLFPAKWLGCDAVFGSNRKFRDKIGEKYYYFADQRCNTKVWLEKPPVGVPPYKGKGRKPTKKRALEEPVSLEEIIEDPSLKWEKIVLGEGAKGPIVAEVTCLRVVTRDSNELPAEEVWLYLRKFDNRKIKYAFCNAPADIAGEELDKAALMRWPIEQSFKAAKDQLGMDEYEIRSWKGWHRIMLYVFLAMLFLLIIQFEFKKESPVLTLPQAKRLVNASLTNDEGIIIKTIRIINYYLKKNYAAYLSHRKRILANHFP